MTKSEAIELLKNTDSHGLPSGYVGNYSEAIKMAIQALESQPCEDCISREAVLDAVNNVLAPFIPILWGSPMAIPLEIARAINNLPPVTPTIPEVENDYNIGYNCGYADAMSDVAEMRGDEG